MERENLYMGQKVLDGDEVVTVIEIFQQQNPSPSNDILVEDVNKVQYTVYHEFLDEYSTLTEKAKIEMYGDMTQKEINLVYYHEGNYKGWICVFTGCGNLLFEYRGLGKHKSPISECENMNVKNWIPELWKRCKQKIDKMEN